MDLKSCKILIYGILLMLFIGCKNNHRPKSELITFEKQTRKFDTKIDSLYKRYKIPGLSIAIAHNDSVIFKKGYGYANLESKISSKPETNYRIASLTKPMSATILLSLEEKNIISLQDSIKQYITGYENYYSQVKDYVLKNQPELSVMIEDFNFERDDIKIWHHITHTTENTPGDSFKYNGFIFGALSRVMELKLEKPYHQIIKEQIIEKCDMNTTASSQFQANEKILQLLSQPYEYLPEDDEFITSEYPDPDVNASSGLVSNVLDILKFDEAINNNTLISSATKEMAWTNQQNNAGEKIPYGLGWYVQEKEDVKIVWHYGWHPEAFSGLYMKLPESGFTVVMLANGENLSAPFMENGYDKDVFASPFAKLFFETFKPEIE